MAHKVLFQKKKKGRLIEGAEAKKEKKEKEKEKNGSKTHQNETSCIGERGPRMTNKNAQIKGGGGR